MDAPSSLPSPASVVARPLLLAAAALLCHWQAGGSILALTVMAFLLALATPWLAAVPRFPAGLAWAIYAGALAGGLALAAGFVTWGLLPFALLVSGQSLVLTGLGGLGAPDPARARHRYFLMGLTALVVTAAPVWLAPLLEATQQAAGFHWLVAGNPVLHLGTALGGDPLRSDWLYRHSPMGSYDYRYLGTGTALAATWALAALSWAAAEYDRRRLAAFVSSTRDPGDDP